MDVSTQSMLFYGILLMDEPMPWDKAATAPDWEEFYVHKQGVKRPIGKSFKENEEDFKKYWKEKAKALKACDVEVGVHHSSAHPFYYVAMKDFNFKAISGHARKIALSVMPVIKWNNRIKDFCGFMGLPYSQPAIHLANYWS